MWKIALLLVILFFQVIAYLYVDHKKINKGRFKILIFFFLINILLLFILSRCGMFPEQRAHACGPSMEFFFGVVFEIMTIVVHVIYYVIDFLAKRIKPRFEK